jgi:hypothetical protein
VTADEMRAVLAPAARNTAIDVLGTDLDSLFRHLLPGLGMALPAWAKNPGPVGGMEPVGPRDKGRAMCGIAGVAGPAPADALARRVRAAGAAQRHRGPDDEGVWAAAGFAFGMTRLSIIDLAGGHQPMFTPDGMGIVFNGEIYNYRRFGPIWRPAASGSTPSRTTEVVLRLIRRDGWDALARLEGMFAFALHDPRKSGCTWFGIGSASNPCTIPDGTAFLFCE